MTFADKRFVLKSLAAAAALAGLCGQALAQEAPQSIRIGWAIAKTGVNAGGTSVTTAPNYKLWVKEINDAGGIMLKAYNKRVPIEVIEYDDRSSTEEAVRATERLITQDKVDFVLPPWGTGSNLAVGPTYEKHKYPLLAATSVTDKAPIWPSAGNMPSSSWARAANMPRAWSPCWKRPRRTARSTTRSP